MGPTRDGSSRYNTSNSPAKKHKKWAADGLNSRYKKACIIPNNKLLGFRGNSFKK
jgi:hypothetical protein